jgi:hypothetical protein
MMRCGAAFIFFTVGFTAAAVAQASAQSMNMSEVAVGDHWTYEVRDESEGKITLIEKVIVTDIADNKVATRTDFANTDRFRGVIYDKSWNIFREGPNHYSPSSGTGIRLPLTLNAEWQARVDQVSDDGFAWIINVNSQVTGQENVTTKTGTFQTYIIDTTQIIRSTRYPKYTAQISFKTWFSPEVNRWVRRNVVRREEGLIIRNQAIELVEYGRKTPQ